MIMIKKSQDLKVRIYAEGTLSAYLPDQPIQLPSGVSIRECAVLAGIPENKPFAAVVNQRVEDLNYCLKPGDEVHLYPQISGGGE